MKTSVPTRIAVMGSKTPKTEAFVAPIFRVAMAKVAVETMVGRMASPKMLSQSPTEVIPAVTGLPESTSLPKKMIAPTVNA